MNVTDIDWIEAADYYSFLHVGTRKLMLRETIKQLASTLDPSNFVRIHRSVIVNVTRVSEIFREGRGEGAVNLTDGQRLRMSRVRTVPADHLLSGTILHRFTKLGGKGSGDDFEVFRQTTHRLW